jgi:hypothetical protein
MKTGFLTALVCTAAAGAAAQSADPVFTLDPWNLRVHEPRILGLAGIFVTMAEGSAALPLSPAAAFTPSRDASVSFRGREGAGYVQSEGKLAGGMDWAWGARIEHSFSREFEGDAALLTDPTRTIDSGHVTFEGYDVTFGVATHWRRGLVAANIGGSFTAGVLQAAGTYASVDVDRQIDRRYGYSGDAVRAAMAASTIGEVGHEFTPLRLRVGVAWQWFQPATLQRETLELRPAVPPAAEPRHDFELRHPSAWSVGADLRLPAVPVLGRLTLAGQVDRVDYADIEEPLRVGGGAPAFGFPEGSDYDYSVAAEAGITWPRFLRDKLRVRGGTRWESEHTLRQDPGLAPEDERLRLWFFGASVDLDVLMHARIELDFLGGFEDVAIGIGVRF